MFCPILWSLHQTHRACTESYICPKQQRSISNSNKFFKTYFTILNWNKKKEKFLLAKKTQTQRRSDSWAFWSKVVFEEVHFWQGGFNISRSWIMGTLLRLKTNSANFLIWRWKSETQPFANFYNALVDSVLKLYRPLIWYSPTILFFNSFVFFFTNSC